MLLKMKILLLVILSSVLGYVVSPHIEVPLVTAISVGVIIGILLHSIEKEIDRNG